MPTRILLVDDHALVRRGLAALVGLDGRFAVVAEAGNGEQALLELERCQPDLVLLDLSMPKMDGLAALRHLKGRRGAPRVLVVSMYDDPQFVARALAAGADGYVLKQALDDELFSALEAVTAGQRYLSDGIDRAGLEAQEMEAAELTARELEVLQLIAQGHTTLEVSEALAISPHTATRHRANLMQKLDAHNQVELVRAAVARGLILMPRR